MKKNTITTVLLFILLLVLASCGSDNANNDYENGYEYGEDVPYINEGNIELPTPAPEIETPAPPPVVIMGFDDRVRIGFLGERAFDFHDIVYDVINYMQMQEGFILAEPSFYDASDVAELRQRLSLHSADNGMINAFIASFSDFSSLGDISDLYLGIILHEPTEGNDEYVGLFLRGALARSHHSRPLIATGFQRVVDVNNVSLLIDDTTTVQLSLRNALNNASITHTQIPENASRIVREANGWLRRGQLAEIRFAYVSGGIVGNTGDSIVLRATVDLYAGDVGDVSIRWYDENGLPIGIGEIIEIDTTGAGDFIYTVRAFNSLDGEETSAEEQINVIINTWDAEVPQIMSLTLRVDAVFTIYAATDDADLIFTTYISDIGAHLINLVVDAVSNDGGTLYYQWYQIHNGVSSRINQATTNVLTIEAGVEGEFQYYVVVTNTNLNASGEHTASATSSMLTIILKAEVPPPYLEFDIFFNGRSRTFDIINVNDERGGCQRTRLEQFVEENILNNPRVDHIRVDGRFWYYEPGVIEGGISLARALLVTNEMRSLGVTVPIHPTANFEQYFSGWLQRRARITVSLRDE